MIIEKVRLGEVLIKQGLINPSQLEAALSLQKQNKRKLGKVLVEQGFINEEQIAQALSKQLHLPYTNLHKTPIDNSILTRLNEVQARKFRAIVIRENKSEITVAMSDPTDLFTYDELSKIFKKEVLVEVATEEAILNVIDRHYRKSQEISSLAKELEQDIKTVTGSVDFGSLNDFTVEDAPVIKLLQSIFEEAANLRASDIHIEPQKDKTLIRLRVDGVLIVQSEVDLKICAPLISRLKIISNLDIAEKRVPQDGRFQIKIKNNPIDVRISTTPLYTGEAAVLRLLTQNQNILHLTSLNMPQDILISLQNIVHQHEGMLLVTGPTGSGKTTTLYAALTEINQTDKKIITIEDPVEYHLPLINQIQVNEKIDLSFSRVLRSVLRQDPDCIMIGEIRDGETAQIAMRGAITGHLILSTIHTKDTASTPIRLIDMGVPNYMVASALQGVLSQRLIRTTCPHCSEEYQASEKDELWLKTITTKSFYGTSYKKGKGCDKCHNSGYLGRTGVYELLEFDTELTNCLHNNDLIKFNELAKEKLQGKTMVDNIVHLICTGQTTIDEAKRMIG